MVRVYENGADFLEDNRAFLDTNPYMSTFFFLDAPLLKASDQINYAIKIEDAGKSLLALKIEPYSMLVFGNELLSETLLDTLMAGGYEIRNLLGSEQLCDRLTGLLRERYGIEYFEALPMDFMEADTVTEPSAQGIEIPTDADVDELTQCMAQFCIDCGLQDKVTRERIAQTRSAYRILRRDGKIACMAKISPSTEKSLKIADVYTRPECRGMGLARIVVNAAKNEILEQGMIATLNVDKRNPVTNHLYRSLGFKVVFSQGEYRRK